MNYDARRERARRRRRNRNIITAIIMILIIVPIIFFMVNILRSCSSAKIKDNRVSSSEASEQSSETSENDGILVPTGPSDDASEISIEPSVEPSSEVEPSKEPESSDDPATMNEKIAAYVSSETSEMLRLVNKNNVLPSDFEPETTEVNNSKQFSVIGAQQLDKMINDCNKACGNKLWAQSTYRAYSKQEKLYNNEVQRWIDKGYSQKKAEKTAATIVAPPGTSEHNTGLACDFNTVTEAFANTDMYPWLIEHCAEYGFIERFPKDKQDITGIIWEPWHYRYVGVEAATEIMENGWCLEEYHYYKGM